MRARIINFAVTMVGALAIARSGRCGNLTVQQEPAAIRLAAVPTSNSIEVRAGDALFTTYRFGPDQKYPYFYPVCGPVSGRSLTTESSEPYPHHHSLFFGCDRVNGCNFWQEENERGQIVSRGARIAENGPGRIVIEDICDWRAPGWPPVLEDRRRIVVQAPTPSLRLIDFHIRLVPVVEVKIERTNHSLFAVRVAPHISIKNGGRLVNAEGLEGERETWGKESPWCDFSGRNENTTEGIAIFDHPANRWFSSKWFTRDYGFMSPTPMNWLPDEGLRLERGVPVVLHYRVVVHAGDSRQADLAGLFAQWRQERF